MAVKRKFIIFENAIYSYFSRNIGTFAFYVSFICWSPVAMIYKYKILTSRSSIEMQYIKSSIESLIASTHKEQYVPICIIQMHYRVFRHINEFVGSLPLECCRMKVEPVASNVNCHGDLEPEGVGRVERSKCHHETGSSCTVSQLVQHRTKFCAWNKIFVIRDRSFESYCQAFNFGKNLKTFAFFTE